MTTALLEMLADRQTALLDEQRRAWRRMLSLPQVVKAACEVRVGTTPHDVVMRHRSFSLLKYRRETPARQREPVLFCYALINRSYILDLQPEKSVVRRYLEQGFDVYMIDWCVPSHADRTLTLADYVCDFLDRAVTFVLHQQRTRRLHLLGYCMGGTFSTLFTALNPDKVRTLTLLAAPIDFGGRDSLLNVWTDPRYFDVDAFVDSNGNCPAEFLQLCFLSMRPVQNLWEKSITFCEQLDDPRFVENFLAMERWVNDNVPVAGETFREFVKKLYQGNELVRGVLRLRDRPVELGRVECPLLLLTASNDHLVAPASTEGIRPHVASREVRALSVDAGHVGLAVSSKAQRKLWPEAARWLAHHDSRECA